MLEALIFFGGFALGMGLCATLNHNKDIYIPDDTEPVMLSDAMIEALNKDEPRRVHFGYRNLDSNDIAFYCPRCVKELCTEEDAGEIQYCPVCGQKLDWSESEW